MKKFLLLSILLSAATAMASGKSQYRNFGAFTDFNNLYVTILADACNDFTGALKVSDFCDKNRTNKNLAPVCPAEMFVYTSARPCSIIEPTPRVVTIDLATTNVDPRASYLKMSFQGQEITIPINR